MSFAVVIPGQPVSVNAAYKRASIRLPDGSISKRMVKTADAVAYQDMIRLIVAAAKPTGWTASGQVRLRFRLFMTRNIDADNCVKLVSDAVQNAIEINDKYFLYCIESKTTGVSSNQARIELVIDERAACCHEVLASRSVQ